MFNNILDVCGNKRIARIRDLSPEEGPMWKQSWATQDCHIPSRRMGKASLSSSSAASFRHRVPQLLPILFGHKKCLKGIQMSQKTNKPQMCCLGVIAETPQGGQGSDAATKPLLSLSASCSRSGATYLSLINYTLIAPHEQPVPSVVSDSTAGRRSLSRTRFLLGLLALDCPLHVLCHLWWLLLEPWHIREC